MTSQDQTGPILLALDQATEALENLKRNKETLVCIAETALVMARTLEAGSRLFSCGNGGSHCDAMHFAEELSGRFRKSRRALGAMAISDPSHLTCVGNDYGFEEIFSRFLSANGRRGDLVLIISTSGKSPNCLAAAREAKAIGMKSVLLTGTPEGPIASVADYVIATPGTSGFADRVQELHIKVIHILIELIEKNLGLSGG